MHVPAYILGTIIEFIAILVSILLYIAVLIFLFEIACIAAFILISITFMHSRVLQRVQSCMCSRIKQTRAHFQSCRYILSLVYS